MADKATTLWPGPADLSLKKIRRVYAPSVGQPQLGSGWRLADILADTNLAPNNGRFWFDSEEDEMKNYDFGTLTLAQKYSLYKYEGHGWWCQVQAGNFSCVTVIE